jgi:hypothetical protein
VTLLKRGAVEDEHLERKEPGEENLESEHSERKAHVGKTGLVLVLRKVCAPVNKRFPTLQHVVQSGMFAHW